MQHYGSYSSLTTDMSVQTYEILYYDCIATDVDQTAASSLEIWSTITLINSHHSWTNSRVNKIPANARDLAENHWVLVFHALMSQIIIISTT